MFLYGKVVNHQLIIQNQEDAKREGLPLVECELGSNGTIWEKGFVPEPTPPTEEEVRTARAIAYEAEVDPLMSQYNRKKTFNLFKEGEEEALLAEIEAKVAKIKEENPYPEENIVETETTGTIL